MSVFKTCPNKPSLPNAGVCGERSGSDTV